MERIYIYILLYSVLITAIAVPVIVDYLLNRAATPQKCLEKAREVLYGNGFKAGYHSDDTQCQDAAVAETDKDVKG
ncbi:MAG: hypothetical protein IJP50_02945 [Paludibacteraceae bacterium]|nr:hypothetical protein [Paludibacteraceae bacterium]